MKDCVIFCAGEFDKLAAPIAHAYIIAADGGYVHTEKLGIQPNAVLGDFDSLGYIPRNAAVFPVEKDDTDTMLAIRAGLNAGCTDFTIYGALDGPRLDHTLANLQSLVFLAEHGARGTLVGIHHIITTVQSGSICFPAHFTGTVSVFCMGAQTATVTIQGLKYQLENGTLTPAYPLGVSNSFTGQESRITTQGGCLLVVLDAVNGMGWRYE